MVKIIIYILAISSAVAVSVNLSAGEIEDLSTRAEKSFLNPVTAESLLAPVPAALAPEAKPVPAAVSEYQNLAAAFKKGTVPTKEELTGWHAGRFVDRDFPEDPGSILLAGGEMRAEPVSGLPSEKAYKLVPLMTSASPTFYETLDAHTAEGVAIFIKNQQAEWTKPRFGPAGVTFEKIMPSYDKGFSRYEVRKAADNRVLLEHVWKNDMGGGQYMEGIAYAYFTKDITPQ